MLTIKEAYEIAQRQMPNLYIAGVSEIKKGWLFEYAIEKQGEPLDDAPLFVDRESGRSSTFFPPDHDLEEPKEIDIDMIG